MKKILSVLFSLMLVLATAGAAFAYQTVLINFPSNQGWHSVYYGTQGDESILQYVPSGDSYTNWKKTVIFHSYKNYSADDSAALFMDNTTAQMEALNPQPYKYLKYTEGDSIATRCVEKNAYMAAQCEIYRVSSSYEGLISMHYINRNVSNFKNTYNLWADIISGIRIYYSYYRTNRVLNKATSFQI